MYKYPTNSCKNNLERSTDPNITAIFYTVLALTAFAGNSVLCRLALANNQIDPASFTYIRLLSGIITLLVLSNINQSKKNTKPRPNITIQQLCEYLTPSYSTFYLFIYATSFSYAYVALNTGTGALILFGAVQLTLIFINLIKMKRLTIYEYLGLSIAFSGLIYLVYPSLTTPSLSAFIMMFSAGIAWGLYTHSGKRSVPEEKNITSLQLTKQNFIKTLPMLVLLFIISYQDQFTTPTGISLAIASGALTSALGYYVWFIALRFISTIQAGVLQLLVPILATIGGVIFANETISIELIIATSIVLSGILFIMLQPKKKPLH